ncbi:MAG TPA: hypothetical protein VMY05_11485 [Acidobacteriota bacterium]|nr:hypothetical protein [Acidobacteriota bacterium]
MIDYGIFYKDKFSYESDWNEARTYDLFISAYSDAERVRKVYDKIQAARKLWLLMPEFKYDRAEFPPGQCYANGHSSEAEFIQGMWTKLDLRRIPDRIAVDITGFIRPYLMYLVLWLRLRGVRKFDALYSEPVVYSERGKTKFSDELVEEVRQVPGFEGEHNVDTSKDFLIVGSGYDHHFIAHVADYKRSSRKIQLFGLPSLKADMYMENRLRANAAAEDIGDGTSDHTEHLFAPANDPFTVASVLQTTVKRLKCRYGLTNLYLSPLATKPQALGFAIYYIYECLRTPTSIIFPYCASYPRRTAKGITNIWRYVVEFS